MSVDWLPSTHTPSGETISIVGLIYLTIADNVNGWAQLLKSATCVQYCDCAITSGVGHACPKSVTHVHSSKVVRYSAMIQ